MYLQHKEKCELIENFKKFLYKNNNERYYFQLAQQVYRSETPSQDNLFKFNSYSKTNWHWFFTYIMNEEVHPKKTPLWEQSMYPWKKY